MSRQHSGRRGVVASLMVAAGLAAWAAAPAAQQSASGTEDGWVSLFDGQSLNGWRGYRQADASQTRWVVTNSELCVVPDRGPAPIDIVTRDTYEEFDLRWEWRVAEAGNSGVKYFVLEDYDTAIGHEYQLVDDERNRDAKMSKRQTASLYDVLPPGDRQLRPAGQYNESRILVEGNTVRHWLNGVEVLTYELDSASLRQGIANSKFKDVARFGKRHRAHILLQDHNDPVCFRNIRIRPGTSVAR
jgi:hypothetical protein